jgi:hypothetical protein
MKNVLLDRRTQVLAWTTAVVLLWPLLVVPGGAPWSGIIWWTAALACLFTVAATAFVGSALSRLMTQVVPSVAATPKAIARATRLHHCGAGNAQRVTTECAEQRKEG